MSAPTNPLGVGFHHGIPAAQYHADHLCAAPSLSSSVAVELETRSPAHARLKHPRLRPHTGETDATGDTGETDAMAFGGVVHELLLGKGGGFAVWEGRVNKLGRMDYSWRGSEAAAFWESAIADGKSPITLPSYKRATHCVSRVRAQLDTMGLGYILTEGESEQVAIWKNGDHYARAMFDRWLEKRGEIWDIKTTGKSAHPDQIAKIIPAMNYDMRSEFYLMGAEVLTGRPAKHGGLGYQFLFVEVTDPFCITPCYVDSALRARGRRRAAEAIKTWATCMESGHWPGYVNGAVEITAPGWVDYEIDDSEITVGGARVL